MPLGRGEKAALAAYVASMPGVPLTPLDVGDGNGWPRSPIEKGGCVCRIDPSLDPTYAAALLRRATALHIEAGAVLQPLEHGLQIERLGSTELVGSAVSGLMVWAISTSPSAAHT